MRPPKYDEPAALTCGSCVHYIPKSHGHGGYGTCFVDHNDFKVSYVVNAIGGCPRYKFDREKAE